MPSERRQTRPVTRYELVRSENIGRDICSTQLSGGGASFCRVGAARSELQHFYEFRLQGDSQQFLNILSPLRRYTNRNLSRTIRKQN